MFARSVFQSVLERLAAEQGENANAAPSPSISAIQGLSAGFAPDRTRADLHHGADAAGAYRAFGQETEPDDAAIRPKAAHAAGKAPPAPEKPKAAAAPEPKVKTERTMPRHLERLAPEEIAAELGLSATDTLESLNEKRRRFARLNHPDRHDAAFQAAATRRMTLANMLIDEAARRLRRRAEAAQATPGKARRSS
ncbi:hypothetical protein BJF93_12260 [Xaviernesmea oryzae]|uniref:J domain-containing protein n=1 Tax=Xaviernesmea oryzae TaxID=464029 RepID=A0A1Q9AVJ0_9HYPH|nr:hypothetical protein [Xaviernesmea oryzae]OLP59471.1 hypothetical protein BJF93_12260 [Xaviernesmea oryzae]SEL58722.1 hypothetical protein SAMN04487976_11017 [Xaviernesmea oryzae]